MHKPCQGLFRVQLIEIYKYSGSRFSVALLTSVAKSNGASHSFEQSGSRATMADFCVRTRVQPDVRSRRVLIALIFGFG
jgi:hypothetical protein